MKKNIATKAAVLMLGAALLTVSAPFLHAKETAPVLSYQLDISRGKVPTMETLYRIVDFIASLGYNEFQLYTEHTFAYKGHSTAWGNFSPITPDEIRKLDDYCFKKGVELVPNQNSFGHFERWLSNDKYSFMAQCPEKKNALNPTNEVSIKFISSLYDELLPCFRSRLFNVGCDEVQKVSQSDYLDFLGKISKLVKERNHTMMFWADIVLEHPETIDKVPLDAIALNWGYDRNYDFEKTTTILKNCGLKFYVCPGTSSWASLVGQTSNMVINVKKAVDAGMKNGAIGYMMADWGDGGYPQPWLVSVPGIIALADRVKRGVVHDFDSLAKRIDEVLGCKVGKTLMDIGTLDTLTTVKSGNDTVLWRMLRKGAQFGKIRFSRPAGERGVSVERMNNVFEAWKSALEMADLNGAPQWVKDDVELLWVLREALQLRVKGEHERVVLEIRPKFSEIWLRQNRIGGLQYSLESNFSETLPKGY
ncbi:MAG: family 20 glycosylhydrolase [Kiritimatiellae bacterium]|nr:family 20 glycosylhydrolase [Kiritimatiellia bacterium]